ncbi:hypothetical protein GGR51DRAFT_544829 [Nemania sp. FL0031]|nr:hypothetical protein GGR51DRAFT_544829 [Nemania sp. FL0031]
MVHSEESNHFTPQGISVGNINPKKLTAKLRHIFGPNSYKVYIIHNTYNIEAPRHLTDEEIDACE